MIPEAIEDIIDHRIVKLSSYKMYQSHVSLANLCDEKWNVSPSLNLVPTISTTSRAYNPINA